MSVADMAGLSTSASTSVHTRVVDSDEDLGRGLAKPAPKHEVVEPIRSTSYEHHSNETHFEA